MSVLDCNGPVGILQDIGSVRNTEDRQVIVLFQFLQHLHDLTFCLLIQIGGYLVQNQNATSVEQSLCPPAI